MSPSHYEHLYIFAVMWSVGAFLELDDRAKMEEFMRGNSEFTLDLPKLTDSEQTMYDYFVDKNGMSLHKDYPHLLIVNNVWSCYDQFVKESGTLECCRHADFLFTKQIVSLELFKDTHWWTLFKMYL